MGSLPVSVVPGKQEMYEMVRDTILSVEQVLQSLPLRGDKVEVTTTTTKKLPTAGGRTTKDVVLPEKSYLSSATDLSISSSKKKEKIKAEVVPGTISVNMHSEKDGVNIDTAVKVKSESGGSRLMRMTIECPDFEPRRLKCDEQWYRIV